MSAIDESVPWEDQERSRRDLRTLVRVLTAEARSERLLYPGATANPRTKHDILEPMIRTQATAAVRQLLTEFKHHNHVDPAPVVPFVANIVDQVEANAEVMIGLTSLRNHDAYTFDHSVNACLLATMIGLRLGHNRSDLLTLGLGAILHDLGKVFISADLLTKNGRLTPDEYEQIKDHPVRGHLALAQAPRVDQEVAMTVLEHHERLDGSGYPQALTRGRLSRFAQIVAVADAYDALASNRPYRCAYNPQECIRILREQAGSKLAADVVEALIARIAPYPPGSTVRLNNNSLAVVVHCPPDLPDRPDVVTFDGCRGLLVRLAEQADLKVTKLVDLGQLDG